MPEDISTIDRSAGTRAATPADRTGWKQISLGSWGRASQAPCLAARPERLRDLQAALHVPEGRRLLAHAAGRSYGDVCLNRGEAVVLTGRLDRILAFDEATTTVVAEPGVTFADLLDTFLPRGLLPPVSPGTAFVTMGGAVANDVHGKNQHHLGCFGDHILWLDLLLPDGRMHRISETADPDLFRATIGGIGLTGIIAAICLKLMPVPSNALIVRRRRMADLDAFLAGFDVAAEASWSVGWIDALAQGASLGRGILETAEPSPQSIPAPPDRVRSFPFDAPGWLLNRASVRAFNAAYWRRVPAGGEERTVPYRKFLYPLDAIYGWNRMYGRAGFHQFQCVVPKAGGAAALRRLLEAVAANGDASFLAVLKAMGRAGRGLLSFAMPGYTLALDVPARPGSAALFATLERITLEAGGRIYLAKDSQLSAAGFAAMYPDAGWFQEIRARVDPQHRLSSDMSRRLGLG